MAARRGVRRRATEARRRRIQRCGSLMRREGRCFAARSAWRVRPRSRRRLLAPVSAPASTRGPRWPLLLVDARRWSGDHREVHKKVLLRQGSGRSAATVHEEAGAGGTTMGASAGGRVALVVNTYPRRAANGRGRRRSAAPVAEKIGTTRASAGGLRAGKVLASDECPTRPRANGGSLCHPLAAPVASGRWRGRAGRESSPSPPDNVGRRCGEGGLELVGSCFSSPGRRGARYPRPSDAIVAGHWRFAVHQAVDRGVLFLPYWLAATKSSPFVVGASARSR